MKKYGRKKPACSRADSGHRRRGPPARRFAGRNRSATIGFQAVNLSRLFILRPVATTLTMVALLIAGVLAYRLLPVSALPEVDYPTIQVVTLYPGASPEVMTALVTSPLERQFGQMPGLAQMTSSSSGGSSRITLQFDLTLPMDVAEQIGRASWRERGCQ